MELESCGFVLVPSLMQISQGISILWQRGEALQLDVGMKSRSYRSPLLYRGNRLKPVVQRELPEDGYELCV